MIFMVFCFSPNDSHCLWLTGRHFRHQDRWTFAFRILILAAGFSFILAEIVVCCPFSIFRKFVVLLSSALVFLILAAGFSLNFEHGKPIPESFSKTLHLLLFHSLSCTFAEISSAEMLISQEAPDHIVPHRASAIPVDPG